MRKLGRKQYGVNNTTDPLNIVHKHLIVPAALETATQRLLATIQPVKSGEVNPFVGLYNIIVEPRLDADSEATWYAAAEPSQIDTIEVCFLDGQSGVRIETDIDFDTDGMKMKAMHDIGVKAIDHRGLFKNAG